MLLTYRVVSVMLWYMNPLSLDLLQGRSSGGVVAVGSDTFCLITSFHLSSLIDPVRSSQRKSFWIIIASLVVLFFFLFFFLICFDSCFNIETLKRGISIFSFFFFFFFSFGSHLEGKFPRCTFKAIIRILQNVAHILLTNQAHDTAPAENISMTPFKFLERLFKEDVNVEASTPKLNCSTSSMFLAFVPSLWKSHTTKRGSTLCDLHKTTRKWLSCFTEHKSFILYQHCMHRVFVFFPLSVSHPLPIYEHLFCTFVVWCGSGVV